MFLGRTGFEVAGRDDGGDLLPVRQLWADDTLVAVVDMLRVLALLNVVVDVQALEVVLIELRQLLDATEPALDVAGRPLRVLLGERARRSE